MILRNFSVTDHLFTAVLAEARMCCCGQPVILAGDFNADPVVIPALAKGLSDGQWVDLERAFAFGKGVPPASTCQFQLDEDKGSRRDFLLACPIALAAATACFVSPDRWFTPHFSVSAEFSLSAWDATVERARTHSPLWPACWLQSPDRSRFFLLPLRFVIFGMFTFERLALFLLLFVSSSFVFVTPLMLIRLGFFGVGKLKLVLLVLIFLLSSYVGRGSLSVYSMRLGGQCHDRIYHVDRSDEFDVTHFGFFLNSSLAPVLRFRRSFVSICNVLKGIKQHGFSKAALELRWQAVVRLGPTGPVTSFEPWTSWIPPDLHGFYKCAMDTLALLDEFVLRVVRHRQSSRSIAWANWIREDLASRPYKWLRPGFVPPAPYLVCRPQDSPNGSGILVQPALIDAHFRKAWMPYFRREGHPVVTAQAFLDFVGDHLLQEPFLDLPILNGEDLYEAVMAKKSTAGGLDGWAWNEIKLFLYLGLLVWLSSSSN